MIEIAEETVCTVAPKKPNRSIELDSELEKIRKLLRRTYRVVGSGWSKDEYSIIFKSLAESKGIQIHEFGIDRIFADPYFQFRYCECMLLNSKVILHFTDEMERGSEGKPEKCYLNDTEAVYFVLITRKGLLLQKAELLSEKKE